MPRVVAALVAILGVSVLTSAALISAQEGPVLPVPEPLTLDPATTAVLVLDLSTRCNNPAQSCHELVPVVGAFLPKARAANVFIAYTASLFARGTPAGEVWEGFGRTEEEPLLYPDSYNKFYGGEIRALLQERNIDTVVVTGASANVAVLYTATMAGRENGYKVVIPIDGIRADNQYEYEYTLHQFNLLSNPAFLLPSVRFTTLDTLEFAAP